MAYRTTRRADQDIMGLYVHGAETFGVSQAERYHAGLIDAFELLAVQPLIARERLEFNPPVRVHVYEAHVILYLAEQDDILIVRVLHGSQDWQRHL